MSSERMTTNCPAGAGNFGYQPTETRGHQPVAARPRSSGAEGPTAAASSSGPPVNPPTQGTSARK
jgi:hypothetical protein